MDKYEIKRQISQLERRSQDLSNDISQKRERIARLNTLKGRISSCGSELEARHARAKAGVSSIKAMDALARSASSYAASMDDCVNGTNYRLAVEGIASSQRKVQAAISEAQDTIAQDQREITRCRNKINDLYVKLRILAIEEAAEKVLGQA